MKEGLKKKGSRQLKLKAEGEEGRGGRRGRGRGGRAHLRFEQFCVRVDEEVIRRSWIGWVSSPRKKWIEVGRWEGRTREGQVGARAEESQPRVCCLANRKSRDASSSSFAFPVRSSSRYLRPFRFTPRMPVSHSTVYTRSLSRADTISFSLASRCSLLFSFASNPCERES